MKKTIVFLVISLVATVCVKSAGDPYLENMLTAKAMTDTATNEQTLLMAANYFIRIAGMNPDQWLPHYYAAYSFARISHMNHEADICDKWVDRAQAEVDKAFALAPGNAEVLVMKGFVLQARMNINPMVRGFRFFEETMGYFNKASEIEPSNPRAYLWKGVNLLHTPEAFGGGKQSGCPLIKEAIAKFETSVVTDSIAPAWGYGYALEMNKTCQ
jgi:hypothetical protein